MIDLVIRELSLGVASSLLPSKRLSSSGSKCIYYVGQSIVLAAGRDTPQGDQPRHGGEGVAIVLTGHAVTAWKARGEQWRSWGSRIIKTYLSLEGGDGKTRRKISCIHILSYYAPTFGARKDSKRTLCSGRRLQCPCWIKKSH